MKLLVTGARDWRSANAVFRELLRARHVFGVFTLIHGDCDTGADAMADRIARRLNWPLRTYPAWWKTEGKAAGPRRNERMVSTERPEYAIAFHKDLKKSKGTADCVERLKHYKVPFHVVKR